MMSKDEVVETFEEYAVYLRLDDQEHRAFAYDKAGRAIRKERRIPSNPAEIKNVGGSIREAVVELQYGSTIDELAKLKDKYSWFGELSQIEGLGPSRARAIHNTLDVDTLQDVLDKSEELTDVDGIGPKTASDIVEQARAIEHSQY
jgi:DNA polymerase/3'-5' exonuclease PolX